MKFPNGNTLRSKLFSEKKALKRLIKKKKRADAQNLIDELTNTRLLKKQKDFWRSLEKLKPKKTIVRLD